MPPGSASNRTYPNQAIDVLVSAEPSDLLIFKYMQMVEAKWEASEGLG
ncbi:hypothetical protein COLO4_27246 [Corchorus olitorius]|uniref:Uncharacterized protein n=1 Tax=Corchorus olitorius TaxID=93759 RepID=A0A1R3HS87_9ROSI|nr:hypothetical protein COLO4_27246 [Corchorus olitorius]